MHKCRNNIFCMVKDVIPAHAIHHRASSHFSKSWLFPLSTTYIVWGSCLFINSMLGILYLSFWYSNPSQPPTSHERIPISNCIPTPIPAVYPNSMLPISVPSAVFVSVDRITFAMGFKHRQFVTKCKTNHGDGFYGPR